MGKTNATAEIQRDLLIRIRTEGVIAAYEASLAICRDPQAPAPARATASGTIFRAAGMFDRKDSDRMPEPHEMTAEQLTAEVKRLTGMQLQPIDEAGIFG